MPTSKWFLPGFAVLLGGACFAAFWVGDEPRQGVFAFGVMVAVAAVVLLGGRSEMIRGLRGDGRDEYWQQLDLRASVVSGLAAITAIIVMCLWEWAHGRDGTPYAQLGAIAGLAYLVALGVLRVRS